MNNKTNPATAVFPTTGAIKVPNLKKKRLVDLSPINHGEGPGAMHSKKSSMMRMENLNKNY